MTMTHRKTIDRRRFLRGAALTAATALVAEAAALEVSKDVASLKPGEFTWYPERQRTGPVAIVVSLPEQRVHVYRNGIRIAASTCSSGKPGHETPTGVFVVLQKDKDHRSSTYNDAPMPNMNRLTWSGIALHAGNLPGYPASHGCVRLPLDFSARLFGITHIGTPVIISGQHSDPQELVHPGMVLGAYAAHEFETVVQSLKGKARPHDWTDIDRYPVASVIASTADRRIMLVENARIVEESSLSVSGSGSLGNHVYVLNEPHSGQHGMEWIAIAHASSGGDFSSDSNALGRLRADDAFIARLQARMHPGTVMIITDNPLHPGSRSDGDFLIMS